MLIDSLQGLIGSPVSMTGVGMKGVTLEYNFASSKARINWWQR
jgi:hypothetical protein